MAQSIASLHKALMLDADLTISAYFDILTKQRQNALDEQKLEQQKITGSDGSPRKIVGGSPLVTLHFL